MNDAKLWKVFSEFIRLRDSNEQGYGQCFTCPAIKFWKDSDCGHALADSIKQLSMTSAITTSSARNVTASKAASKPYGRTCCDLHTGRPLPDKPQTFENWLETQV